MSIDIQHDGPARFALAGLDLNVPVDLVAPTKYSRATNITSKIEGQVGARDGITRIASILNGSPIHTIFRLTQFNPSVASERLVGIGSSLYSAPIPDGSLFGALGGGPTFDGGPLSIIQFQFDADPATWAIIANNAGMMKRRAGYYQVLGVAPPSVQANATAGGAGLLNSSTGTPYDWRYTYLNEVTQSESNGSPISVTGSSNNTPTAFTNPAPSTTFGLNNPQNAIDGNPLTASSIAIGLGSGIPTRIYGCLWRNCPAASSTPASITLSVNSTAITFTSGNGIATIRMQYSTDAGVTWINVYSVSGNSNRSQIDQISLPVGTDLTKLQVRNYDTVSGGTISGSQGSISVAIFDISVIVIYANAVPVTLNLTNQSANVCVTPPTDPQETAIRLYRRGGTLPDNWFNVGQFPVASLVQGSCGAGMLLINDNIPDSQAELGSILPQDNFEPIQSVQAVNFPLPIVFGPSAGRVLACGDPARPAAVYFSNVGNADIWGAEAWINVANPGEQVMNGLVYNLRTFAFSRERMYIMLPNIIVGVTFTPAETSCRRGLKGRWALTSGEQGIYFVAKDGIYRTQGGPEQSIIDDSVRPLFPTHDAPVGTPTNGYDAVNLDDEDGLRMAYHNGEIWFDYTGLTTGLRQRLIYDERRSRWRPGTYTPRMQLAYSEPNVDSSLLFGGTDGALYAAGGDDDAGTPISVELTTGAFDQLRPLNLKEYLNVVFDVDPGGATSTAPIIVIPRVNGETISEMAIQITGTGRQRVPLPLNQNGNEVYAYNIEFDITWAATPTLKAIFYQYETLYRHEPAEVTHWEFPQNSMGQEGVFHLRDVYLVYRSTASLTFNVTPDGGTTQTYTIPSSDGTKRTFYVQLLASKGNSYGFTIDSAAPFRLYSEECEVRVKQWLTKLGYKNVPIIGREQVGRPFGLTNV